MQIDYFSQWNPCKYGHVWLWESSTAAINGTPPDWLRCRCGAATWGGSRTNNVTREINHAPRLSCSISVQSFVAIEELVCDSIANVIKHPEEYDDPQHALQTLKQVCEEMGFNFAEIEKEASSDL